jgi:uncharacterized protein GlcG (DUF336 family)
VAPEFFTWLASVSHGRVVPVPGGVLIREAAGEIIGAVGISGDYRDNNEACAVLGIQRVGLMADTGVAAAQNHCEKSTVVIPLVFE